MSYDSTIKVTFLGDVNTGKSSLIHHFIVQKFDPSSCSTIGASNYNKAILFQNKEYMLSIWDTAGQERYKSISKMLYRDAKAVVLVFDLTSKQSFESLPNWRTSVLEVASSNVIIIIAANKEDAIEATGESVNREEAVKYCESINVPLFFCSAKTGKGVNLIFDKILESYTMLYKPDKEPIEKRSFLLSDTDLVKKKGKCC